MKQMFLGNLALSSATAFKLEKEKILFLGKGILGRKKNENCACCLVVILDQFPDTLMLYY